MRKVLSLVVFVALVSLISACGKGSPTQPTPTPTPTYVTLQMLYHRPFNNIPQLQLYAGSLIVEQVDINWQRTGREAGRCLSDSPTNPLVWDATKQEAICSIANVGAGRYGVYVSDAATGQLADPNSGIIGHNIAVNNSDWVKYSKSSTMEEGFFIVNQDGTINPRPF